MIGRKGMNPLTALLAAAMACALLVGAAGAGMHVPDQETLSGISSASALDYARFPGTLSRLSSNFISKALGFGAGLDAIGTSSRSNRGSGSSVVDGAGRIVVKHALTNDDFDDAYVVESIPFTALTNTSGATRQNEPNACAPTGGTVWYRYRPLRDEGLVASTIGTKHATSLAVFTGTDRAHLTQVKDACHTNVQGNAFIPFPAKRATTYYFQITAIAGGGPLVFNLDPSGTTEMVSLNLQGKHGNSSSWYSVISTGGRYVLFCSGASDLVANDTNGFEDMFVRDLVTGTTELVSVSSQGVQGNGESKPWPGAISADGRFVAFNSVATNLVPGDTNGAEDVFVRDRVTHQTTRVSVSSSGRQGEDPKDPWSATQRRAYEPDDDSDNVGAVSISADGRFVAFDSELVGLVPEDDRGDENELGGAGHDVFVHDRNTGRTSLVSRSSEGANGDAFSLHPDISADGRYVAFGSSASNLIDGDPQSGHPWVREATVLDLFVHDLATARTERVSLSDSGEMANDESFPPSISADGHYVAFASAASNLIEGDTNQGIDVFVRDRWLGRTERVSVSSTGEEQYLGEDVERAGVNPPKPDMSWDGRYVVFNSPASNLVPRDTNNDNDAGSGSGITICETAVNDIFLRDRIAGTTTRVSDSSSGTEGNGGSHRPSMSADARRITFDSRASNLVEPGIESSNPACYHSSDSFLHTIPVLH